MRLLRHGILQQSISTRTAWTASRRTSYVVLSLISHRISFSEHHAYPQEHYLTVYGKPIWVTEFACVDGQSPAIHLGYASLNSVDNLIRTQIMRSSSLVRTKAKSTASYTISSTTLKTIRMCMPMPIVMAWASGMCGL